MKYHVLVVEDDDPARRDIVEALKEAIPEAAVEDAACVQDGEYKIRRANGAEFGFDAAVLDFLLPLVPGGPEKIDESLCLYLRNTAKVIHASLYKTVPQVQEHMKNFHGREGLPSADYVDKMNPDFAQEAAQLLKTYLYSLGVRKQISAIFARPSPGMSWGSMAFDQFRQTLVDPSLSYSLLDVSEDISAHWKDLDAETRTLARKYFYIDAAVQPVLVRLTAPESSG